MLCDLSASLYHPRMSSTSFSYFQSEDRLLVVVQPGDHKLWLTRRLTLSIVDDIARLFASQVPGDGIPGAGNEDERIALEHRMAMNEEDLDGRDQHHRPLQFSDSAPARPGDSDILLCTGLDAQLGRDYASLSFVCGDKTLNLRQSRPGFHRFLRTLLLCADKAEWQLPAVPAWLTQSLLGELLANLPPLDENDEQDLP